MHIQAATKIRHNRPSCVLGARGGLRARWSADGRPSSTPPEIENPSTRYLVARDGTDIAGFAILQGVGKRPSMHPAQANSGRKRRGAALGSRLLRSVLQVCFHDLAGATGSETAGIPGQ